MMEVLLLCGYRPHPIGLETLEDGELWLDCQIRTLQELSLSPVVVLAGIHADQIIRESRRLESCELVFDVNGDQSTLLSNLQAGLHATQNACFVLPAEVPVPPEAHWKHLKAELIIQGLLTHDHVIQVPPNEGAPWQRFGFPFLVSAVGNRVILDLENATGLTDKRIRYRHLPALELATPA